jgi:hypothetical protein
MMKGSPHFITTPLFKSHLGRGPIWGLPWTVPFITFIVIIFFPSCSTFQRPGFREPLGFQEVETILSGMREQEERVDSFYTLGSISVKGSVWESTADILIIGLKNPRKIKIEITHPWGRPILHFLIYKERLEVLSYDEKKIYLGSFTPEAVSRFLPGVMADPDLIWAVLRGYPHLIKDYGIRDLKPGLISLSNRQEEEFVELYPGSLLPKRVSFPRQNIHLVFSDFQENNGIIYAREVTANQENEKQEIMIHNKKMVFNTTIPEQVFTLKKPVNFQIIDLDEDHFR